MQRGWKRTQKTNSWLSEIVKPRGIKASTKSQPKLIPTNKHSTTTQVPQMFQNLQVIIGLNGITNYGVQPFQCILVGFNIPSYLGLAVQIERSSLNRFHDVMHLEALTVQIPIFGFGETVLKMSVLCVLHRGFDSVLRENRSESTWFCGGFEFEGQKKKLLG